MASGDAQVVDKAADLEDEGSDADFDAGFSGTTQSKTATPGAGDGQGAGDDAAAADATGTGTDGTSAAATPAAPDAGAAPAPKKVEIDETELADLRTRASGNSESMASIQKQFDKVFGQVGGLKEIITKLQTATPAGEVVELTEADMGELSKEYPELAKLQLGALNTALKKFKGTGTADPEAIGKVVTERLATARAEIRKEVRDEIIDSTLNAVLPRWREKVGTPAYAEWIKVQPAEVQKLADSDDIADAADLMRKFRTHLSKPAPTPAPTPTPAPRAGTGSPRQRQMAAAVTPKGDGTAPAARKGSEEDDDFQAGFKGR